MRTDRLDGAQDHTVPPPAEEALRVGKLWVGTGRLRVSVSMGIGKRPAREALRRERVAVGRGSARGGPAPAARQERGGTAVVRVPEGVLVVERRPVLREEIRPRLVAAEGAVEQPAPPRRERAAAGRMRASAAGGPDAVGNPTPAGPAA